MVALGLLIHTAVFSNPVKTRTYTGGTQSSFVTFATTKCSLRQRNSAKTLESGEVVVGFTWDIECHFQPTLLNNVGKDTIVAVDGRTCRVLGYELLDQKKFFYRFILSSE